MQVRMIATDKLVYAKRALVAGEVFTVETERHAQALELVRKARRAPERSPSPPLADKALAAAVVESPISDSPRAKRNRYQTRDLTSE